MARKKVAKKVVEEVMVVEEIGENTPPPEFQKLTVYPDEVVQKRISQDELKNKKEDISEELITSASGIRYLTIGEEFSAPVINRQLNRRKVKRFATVDWEISQWSDVCLLRVAPKVFAVIDGNHRFNSTIYRGEPGKYNAYIYEWGVNVFSDEDVEWIFDQKSGKGDPLYKKDERLYSLQMRSIWPQIFKEYNLEPLYKGGTLVDYRWLNVLSARHNASLLLKFIEAGGTPIEFTPVSLSMLNDANGDIPGVELWFSKDTQMIRNTAQALKLWQPMIAKFRKVVSMGTLWSKNCLALVIAIYEFTEDKDLFCESIGKMISDVNTEDFKGLSSKENFKFLVGNFMRTLNKRRISRLIYLGKVAK